MPIKVHPSIHVHPGPWLRRNIVEPHGFTVVRIATHLGISRPAMSALLNGRAGLSAMMALRFEKAFGISADTLLRMQSAYDLAQARSQEKDLRVARVAA